MRILVDTNVLIQAQDAPRRLPPRWQEFLTGSGNQVWYSAISIAEISIKATIGKLRAPDGYLDLAQNSQFLELSFTVNHAATLARLPLHHKDPFDRMLIAQAQAEQLTIMTTDSAFAAYDVELVP